MKSYCRYVSPVGTLFLVGERGKIERVVLSGDFPVDGSFSRWACDDEEFRGTIDQLDDYFSGRRLAFDLELNLMGTEFQKTVWRELNTIPYGSTVNYGELAKRVGNPRASRAVGAAIGRNPIPIIIPCHRVIGKDGTLTGYAGGLRVKQRLLWLEEQHRGKAL